MSAQQRRNWSVPLDPDRCPGFTRGHYDICTAVARGIARRIHLQTHIALDQRDIAQAAMAHLLQHSGGWDGKRRGYLWRAARWGAERHAKLLMRRGAKHRGLNQQTIASLEGERSIQQEAAPSGNPVDAAALAESCANLRAAMAVLPAREREILWLYNFERLTGDEIGERLHMSRARVHQLRYQAMRRLRAALPKGLALAG